MIFPRRTPSFGAASLNADQFLAIIRAGIDAMFRGEKINVTEKRAVLHVALRTPKGNPSSWTAKISCLRSRPCLTR